MTQLLDVILPVFIVLGFGYVARWRGLLSDDNVGALMGFAQNFAVPCLLFSAISTLDLSQNFDVPLLVTFYTGALAGFVGGILGGRYMFRRSWEDAVAFGFCGLFSNSVLLGLPIMERAFGPESLGPNYAIVSIHAASCYGLGMTVMEITRARGAPARQLPGKVLRAMFKNALILGVVTGFAVNLSGITVPGVVTSALDLMVRAALPTALFALGGVLYRYRPEGDLRAAFFVVSLSLVLHPGVVWVLGQALDLSEAQFRSAVVTAAMAPGVNTFLFANMYGAARRVAATSVLLGTGASIFSVWFWLYLLG